MFKFTYICFILSTLLFSFTFETSIETYVALKITQTNIIVRTINILRQSYDKNVTNTLNGSFLLDCLLFFLIHINSVVKH